MLGDAGRDVLIGGLGADYLNGGNDEDILIAGSLRVDLEGGGSSLESDIPGDAYDQILAQLLGAWSASGMAARPTLESTGVEVSGIGSTVLDAGHVLSLDDGAGGNALDTLAGGAGADWFFMNLAGTTAQRDKATLDISDFVTEDSD